MGYQWSFQERFHLTNCKKVIDLHHLHNNYYFTVCPIDETIADLSVRVKQYFEREE